MQVHSGRIAFYHNCWLNITNNNTVLNWVKTGVTIPFVTQPYQTMKPNNHQSLTEQMEMSLAIDNLLELGAISHVEPIPDQYISKTFLALKASGSKRFILNLKSLNKFIPKNHFKMEDFRTACKLLQPNWYMANIDLKESYLLVPISVEDRKYLRFEYIPPGSAEPYTYEFNAMPYGLAIAPRCFTKITKEVVTHLRSKGYKSVHYLDDFLCLGRNYNECIANVRETILLLECLGFVINYDKSSLQPQQSCKFLGFIYNTTDMTLSLPIDKRQKILQLVQKFLSLPTVTIREFSKLIGTLVSACPAMRYGWLYTKILEREKYLLLQKYKSYDQKVDLPPTILQDLYWWNNNVLIVNNPIKQPSFDLTIYTDASRTGWGAYSNDTRVNGGWKDEELGYHINYLELLSVFFALKCFAKNRFGCSILLRVDNTTAISYINRMGGIQFPHLNALARDIWQWCEKRNIWLHASYINTKENVEADEESRKINSDVEWELSNSAFEYIVQQLGRPELDLFASRTNAKCRDYVSWYQDPDAVAVDAFTISWQPKLFYAFPPFCLILNCIQKIIHDEATGILVFPMWPGQPWYPKLMDILVSEIVILHPNPSLLSSRFRRRHPLHQTLTLGAALLSGSRSLAADAHRRPST